MRLTLLALTAALAAPALAQTAAPAQQPANEQVIVPEVQRRDVRIPQFPSKDFEVGLLAGLLQGASGDTARWHDGRVLSLLPSRFRAQ